MIPIVENENTPLRNSVYDLYTNFMLLITVKKNLSGVDSHSKRSGQLVHRNLSVHNFSIPQGISACLTIKTLAKQFKSYKNRFYFSQSSSFKHYCLVCINNTIVCFINALIERLLLVQKLTYCVELSRSEVCWKIKKN